MLKREYKGKLVTLEHITNLDSIGNSYFKLTYGELVDYPVKHVNAIAYDRPEAFPKIIRKWVENLLK